MAMGDANQLASEWRAGVQTSIRDLLTVTERTANDVNSLTQIAKAHGERIAKLEASPANVRSLITGYGGCLAYAVSAAIGCASMLVGAVALAVALLRH